MTSLAIGGYYPFPDKHLPAAASLFKPAAKSGGFLLDACAGEGAALDYLAKALKLTPYANELDIERAAECKQRFGLAQTVQGDLFTLRTPHNAYALQWINPPYTANKGGAEEGRREFEMLQHAWQWTQFHGYSVWVVYAHHMTQRAARFLLENSDVVDVYRIPGLHLGEYPQIVVVARKTEKHDVSGEAVLALFESCQHSDSLPSLEVLDEPRYRLPDPPSLRRFYFHPDKITPEVMLPALEAFGVQHLNTFQAVTETPPSLPDLTPIVPPRGGQIGLILAAGLFDGLLLDLEQGQAAVRGVVRMVEVNTTPPGMEGVREVFEIRPQVTITLLHRDGKITTLAGTDEAALVQFIKTHRSAFLKYLDEHSTPIYDFNYDHLNDVFARVFKNRRLPGRPTTGLFETQRHVVGAAYAALQTRKGIVIQGEMGTGKTAMGAAVAAALHAKGHFKAGEIVIVMCPPHLTRKWQREVHDAIPGCVAEIVDNVDDVVAFMRRSQLDAHTLHVMILSREKAKLGEGWEPAFLMRKRYVVQWPYGTPPPPGSKDRPRVVPFDVPACPHCGVYIAKNKDGSGVPVTESWLKQQPRKCHTCGRALWQFKRTFSAPKAGEKFPSRNPRYPLARFLRQRYPSRIGAVLLDEMHELKSEASDQGRAMHDLVHAARKAIGLTGTLFGGMSSSVFWLEWAMNPRMPRQYPIGDNRAAALRQWVRTMGVLERIVEYKEDEAASGSYSGVRRIEHAPQEAPGLSPRLVAELVDHCLWVGLQDMNFALPEYTETPVELSLPENADRAYHRARDEMIQYLMQLKLEGDNSFLSTYLQAALRYPSSCFRPKSVTHRLKELDETGERIQRLVTLMPGFGEDAIYPKEQWLLDQLRTELAEGRKCGVYVAQTGTLDIQPRLEKLIRQHVPGAKVAILRQDTVATDRRDEYLGKQVKAGCNVLVCNPRLVTTGLDLLDFPTLIFYEVDYSLYVVSQAARRAWRIGQTHECRVFYPYYAGTMEEQAIALISKKQAAAALLGGDADGGGLAQLAGGSNSLLAELAKTIAGDAAVVDATQLFRRKAAESVDFTSGWAENIAARSRQLEPEPVEEVAPEPVVEVHASKSAQNGQVTPVYQQYLDVKRQFPKAILLFRLGDFYEAFNEDAQTLVKVLDVVLTSRNITPKQRVPMAGIPHHAAEKYIARLIEQGYHVAICEQMSDEPINGIMPREVVRVVKPERAKPTHALPTTLREMHAAFLRAKRERPDALVFVETAEGYVTFGPDANAAGRELEIAVTRQMFGAEWLPSSWVTKTAAERLLDELVNHSHTVALVNGRIEVRAAKPPRPKSRVTQPTTASLPEGVQQLALFS